MTSQGSHVSQFGRVATKRLRAQVRVQATQKQTHTWPTAHIHILKKIQNLTQNNTANRSMQEPAETGAGASQGSKPEHQPKGRKGLWPHSLTPGAAWVLRAGMKMRSVGQKFPVCHWQVSSVIEFRTLLSTTCIR